MLEINTWSTKASMPTARQQLTSSAVKNMIYSIGGSTSPKNQNEQYDTVENVWETKSVMLTGRALLASASINQNVYCFGNDSSPYSTHESYSVADNSWASKAVMLTGRYNYEATEYENVVYSIGGVNGGTTNEIYKYIDDLWETKKEAITDRNRTTSSATKNCVYVFGGYTSPYNQNEEYTILTDLWETKQIMITGRRGLTSAAVNNKIYCIGGYVSGTVVLNEVYTPETDSWETKEPMTISRNYLSSAMVNNVIYVIGGNSTTDANEAYVADVPSVKYFIYSNGSYYVWDSTTKNWVEKYSKEILLENDYLDGGMDDLNIPFSAIEQAPGVPNICIKKYTKTIADNKPLTILATPHNPIIVFPISDILISDVQSIRYIELLSGVSNFGIVKVIISLDSGNTWYGFDSTNNKFIQVFDIALDSGYSDVNTYGLTKEQLNATTGITSSMWNLFRGDTIKNKTIRFAYYLSSDSVNDIAEVDQISMCVDLRGSWNSIEHPTKYTYAYTNYKLDIKLTESGTYKINYYYKQPTESKTGIHSWNELEDKPIGFNPKQHEHAVSDISNLDYILSQKSNVDHTHSDLHTHNNKLVLDNISFNEFDQPLWNGAIWPGYIDKNMLINNFVDLKDTPLTYSGAENKVVKVNSDASGVEFVELATGKYIEGSIAGGQVARRYSILYGED